MTTEAVRCTGYVMLFMRVKTCECNLNEHAATTPHVCDCGGSWFGNKGEIEEVVSYPQRVMHSREVV